MTGMVDTQVILGTWGQVWVDGDLMSEATAFRAEININYEDVAMCRNLMSGKKISGLEGEGELTMHHVDSAVTVKIAADIKKGVVPDITVVSDINDPNAAGAEKIAVKHVKFEKITLADWERGNLGERSLSFSFSDWELIDTI